MKINILFYKIGLKNYANNDFKTKIKKKFGYFLKFRKMRKKFNI